MSMQSWAETLITAQGDGSPLTNSTSATSLLPAQAKFTLPQQFFAIPGKTIFIRAGGRISTLATSPGTLTLDIRFGSTVVFNGGAMSLNTTAKTNVTWEFEAELTCRVVGSSATLIGIGWWGSEAVIGSPVPTAGGSGELNLPASAPAVGNTFDATATQLVDMFGTWSVQSSSNSITLHQFKLRAEN
jgi:hypothetical protein